MQSDGRRARAQVAVWGCTMYAIVAKKTTAIAAAKIVGNERNWHIRQSVTPACVWARCPCGTCFTHSAHCVSSEKLWVWNAVITTIGTNTDSNSQAEIFLRSVKRSMDNGH